MLRILNTKFFRFAKFAANSAGMKPVMPVVVHRNGNVDMFGRFGKHR